ncbi:MULTISPECIES: nucleoid-associated protein [Vibrio]|uniref:nucleoid-associated protein n=1 Tax=Vibrio TaxID=662 RepID=UPI000C86A904|nr:MULTISPECIES: nucleoid-associated protein [Vibrio]HBC3525318.1 nucleoid-associated protein [Vibrio alginolyticus]EJB8690894.1 nucleoid-associated protein [Vibrio parahaemolyticus]ELA9722050.1 nucleoid-associated protein [Vibrio parahaemolyticus]PMS42346.1 nucleoid-associated protein [Vibrio parahaemolyticus]PMS63152.1 nucleoid-associated protein [Vibrio parahaemolyticus]
MAIKNVILHEVTRDKDGEPVVTNLRDEENSTEGLGSKLTEQLIELFSQSTLNIGEFGVDGDPTLEPAFEQQLKRLHNKEKTFVETTKDMAERFADIISEPKLQSVKGGILAFYMYEYRENTLLAITVLNRIDGINASKDLDLSSATIIDLNRLHLGASINLTDWNEGLSSRYIKFKTGRSVEMRDYFESFIGCQRDKQAATRETSALKTAIKTYSSDLGLDSDETQSKLDSAHSFIQEQQKAGKEVLLTHVANAVFPDSTDDFLAVARNDEHQLSEQIAISSAELKRYVRLSGRGKGVSISFDNELLGKTVTFEDEQLIFTDIPETLKQSIIDLQREAKDND